MSLPTDDHAANVDIFAVVPNTSSISSGGCPFGGDCSCQTPPPAGLEGAVRCENGQWVLIAGPNPQTNQTVVIPQNTTVVRFLQLLPVLCIC
jgi:hypothetical protein